MTHMSGSGARGVDPTRRAHPARPARRWIGALAATAAVLAGAAGCGADGAGGRSTGTAGAGGGGAGSGACEWSMTGASLARTFTATCPSAITPATVGRLEEAWFAGTDDVVTTSPAVVGGVVYVGDWSGTFYALDAATGARRWTFAIPDKQASIYAGQITGGAAVGDLGGVRTVVFGGGKTVYALHAATGALRWKHTIAPAQKDDTTEIETSVAIADGTVLAGYDVHNSPNFRAGVVALDGRTGESVWTWDGDKGREPSGCADVWGSPAVDVSRKLVFFGTGNCTTSPKNYAPHAEAIIAVHLDTGETAWTYQPHAPNNDDLDFAGYPNLFEIDGRPVVGLGNKDGTYYTVDRNTGAPVWKAKATEPGITKPGSGFSTGGFIGGTAVADGVVAGGTAVGPSPYLHGIDARTGRILWQQAKAEATYASVATVNGVLFSGGNDFTLRALDLHTGDILWSHEMKGAVAGGPAVVGDEVFAVAGIREPGSDAPSKSSGVTKFRLAPAGQGTTTTAKATTGGTGVPVAKLANQAGSQPCLGTACPLPFNLKPVPAGLTPTGTLTITPAPYSISITASGLGRPDQWLTPGSQAADEGAKVFALYISESDDNPVGGLLCVLDEAAACTARTLPRSTTYNRITLLAVNDPSTLPPIAQGLARIVTTVSFSPLLAPEAG